METLPLILGTVMGTSGSGIIALIWNIIKDSKAGKLVNEETSIGQMRYLKEEADKRADRERDRADRAWRIVAWYRENQAVLWASYEKLPPSDKQRFPFAPPPDLE